MKAIDQFFPVVLFIMLCKVFLILVSALDKLSNCYPSLGFVFVVVWH